VGLVVDGDVMRWVIGVGNVKRDREMEVAPAGSEVDVRRFARSGRMGGGEDAGSGSCSRSMGLSFVPSGVSTGVVNSVSLELSCDTGASDSSDFSRLTATGLGKGCSSVVWLSCCVSSHPRFSCTSRWILELYICNISAS
jgi:hypothetical protein